MPIQLFPLSGGLNSHIDTRLLPDGALADTLNVELDREGRLIGRAKYTAQAATVYGSGTLVAYDLFSFNDRLFCLGDAHSYGFPVDVYEYLPSGLAAQWKPSSLLNATSPRMPRATQVRDIARPPDQEGGISNMSCAAFGGYVALVWNASDTLSLGFAHVVSAAKNQTILFERFITSGFPFINHRVIALSDRFLFIGAEQAATGGEIAVARFIPASDEAMVALDDDLIGAATVFAVCKVAGADEWMIVANVAGTVTTRRLSSTAVVQVPSSSQYGDVVAAATHLAIEASATANQVTIAMVVGGEARLFAFNYTTGAEIGTGPHVPFSGETSVEISLVRISSTVVQIVSSVTSETAPTIFHRRFTVSMSAFGTNIRAVVDAQLATSAIFSTETFFGARIGAATVGNTPNLLLSSGTTDEEVTPQICKDLETADTVSTLLPDIAFDSSTSKYYWCNATANPDGTTTPVVTEFTLSSTKRRQVTQLGNLAYIAGGCPLVFDGVTLSESGFQERPRIISLTGSNGTGQLIGGATYRYRVHWEWIDSDQNLHLSPPSAISSVTLTSSQDTVTAVVTGPHSMRRNNGSPSGTVACVLSRTLATEANTPASLTGTAAVTPPASSLNGLSWQLFIRDATGDQFFTITFDAGSVTTDAIVTDINAVTTGRITASNVGGAVKLTADDTGDSAELWIYGGVAASAILGFTINDHDTGTTTFTTGENFQRTAVKYTSVGSRVSAYVTVTDLTKDESDPIVDTDLIRQQVLYSQGLASGAHHAPPPSEYIWAGRSRIVAAGQHKRGKFTASKLVVPAEPAEFAFEGFLAFSGLTTGDIEACAVLGDSVVLWTRRQIWMVSGSGPDRSGQGSFFDPACVSKSTGIKSEGWRSLVEDDQGIWFQGNDSQLYRLGRSGQLEWLGKAAQDKLALYPVVTAAITVSSKQEVAFACQATNGATGGILRYNPEAKAWFFDDVGAVASMAEFDGRIAYIQGGLVYIQDAAPGSGTFVAYHVTTGMFQGFDALGYGQLNQVGILGTYRGPCTVEIFVSDDGTDFTTSLGSWALTAAEYAVNDRVRLLDTPVLMSRDSFALKAAVTYASTDSEGVWLHAIAVDTEKTPDFVRLGATHNL